MDPPSAGEAERVVRQGRSPARRSGVPSPRSGSPEFDEAWKVQELQEQQRKAQVQEIQDPSPAGGSPRGRQSPAAVAGATAAAAEPKAKTALEPTAPEPPATSACDPQDVRPDIPGKDFVGVK